MEPVEVRVRDWGATGRRQRLEPSETLMLKNKMFVGLQVPHTNTGRGYPWQGKICFLPPMRAEKNINNVYLTFV